MNNSMSLRFAKIIIVAAVLAIPMASQARVAGAKSARGVPRTFVASYTVSQCVQTATNTAHPVRSPMTYYLEMPRGRMALRELNIRNRGYYIVNHWTDRDGDHFFMYSRRGRGLEYIIPPNRNQPGLRLVYERGTFRPFRAPNRVIKVTGTPSLRCYMQPANQVQAGPHAPAPAAAQVQTTPPPPAPAPAPTPACTSDTDCGGTMVCTNGQCTAPPTESEAPPADDSDSPAAPCVNDIDCDGDLVCVNGTCGTR
jgi:hypothetical protein